MMQPTKYFEQLVPKSTTEILQNHSPAIGAIAVGMQNGDAVVKALLVKAIDGLNNYFNISEKMSADQRIEVINLICKNYSFFKLDDFKLCFENAKIGIYGKVYNRLDGQIIFEWLNKYNEERMDRAESLSIQKHNDLKSSKVNPEEINPEGQKKVVEVLKGALSDFHPEAEKPKSDKFIKRGRTEMDIFVSKCFTHWQKLMYGSGKSRALKHDDGTPTNFVKHYGCCMNQEEFINFKIEQHSRLAPYIKKRKDRVLLTPPQGDK